MRTILVSGASGIVGYGIVRSLKKCDKELCLIGTTIYEDSVAEAFCDFVEIAPLTDTEDYMPWLSGIVVKYDIDLLIPGIEADMYKWTENLHEIELTGAKVLSNNIELVSFCKDKWGFYEYLKLFNSQLTIESSLSNDFNFLADNFGLPFLLKPRRGFGSKGIVIIDSIDTFLKHKDSIGHLLMAQPVVGNDNEEYTTSAFCDGKGSFFASLTLRRKLSKDGYTEKAEVVEIVELNEAIENLCKLFKPVGPTNFQFRKHNDIFKLLEINPRISSATSIRTAFGYNESKMAVEYFFDNKIPNQPVVKQGKAIRYIEDFMFFL